MLCLGVGFFEFIQLEIHLPPWICKFMLLLLFLPHLGSFQSYCFKYFFISNLSSPSGNPMKQMLHLWLFSHRSLILLLFSIYLFYRFCCCCSEWIHSIGPSSSLLILSSRAPTLITSLPSSGDHIINPPLGPTAIREKAGRWLTHTAVLMYDGNGSSVPCWSHLPHSHTYQD